MYFPEVFPKQIFISLNTGVDLWGVVLTPGLSKSVYIDAFFEIQDLILLK